SRSYKVKGTKSLRFKSAIFIYHITAIYKKKKLLAYLWLHNVVPFNIYDLLYISICIYVAYTACYVKYNVRAFLSLSLSLSLFRILLLNTHVARMLSGIFTIL